MAIHHNITLHEQAGKLYGQMTSTQWRTHCSCGEYRSSWFFHETGALDAGNNHKNQKEKTTVVKVRRVRDHGCYGRILARFEPTAHEGYDCVVIREDSGGVGVPFLSIANTWEEKLEEFEVGKKYASPQAFARATYEVVDIRGDKIIGWWWYDSSPEKLNSWNPNPRQAGSTYRLK